MGGSTLVGPIIYLIVGDVNVGYPKRYSRSVAACDYDPPQRVRRMPSWLVGQASYRAQKLVGEALAQEGMRRQHFIVLTSLAEQG